MPATVISPADLQALYDAGAEHVIPKEHAVKELLRLATASSEFEGGREEVGLVLDTEGIIQIKRYEKRGLSLPSTEGEIGTYLGGNSTVPGLTNEELLETFLAIRINAGNWSPLETGMIQTAANLDVFALQVNTEGQKASDFLFEIMLEYSELQEICAEELREGNEAYLQEVLESLNTEANVAQSQALRLIATKRKIDDLIEGTAKYSQENQNLLNALIAFKEELADCVDQVNTKQSLFTNLGIDGELLKKKGELEEKKARVRDLNAQYNKLVGLAFTGAVLSALGLIVTGSIFGKQAAATRREIEKVEADMRQLEQEINELSLLVGVIETLDNRLVTLDSAMHQAEKGVMQLVTIWTTMNTLLQAAYDKAAKVVKAPDVLNLWLDFDATILPWEEVRENAKIVEQQIKEALNQWAKENR
ncbi:MAG: alpha-xenorhabdolysin family binary toxin subunit A [Symploca sp. SIO2D2]|nr:alpha-xenorhabdolysin family binary toxin subunit A [Symploca sp. SIO2D2]